MTWNDLIEQMVMVLRSVEVDLGDERMVIRVLTANGFLSGDVVACMDEAIKTAQRRGQKLPATFRGAR